MSLTNTAFFTKNIIRSIIILGILLLFIYILISIGKSILKVLYPPKETPTLVAFGKLPDIDFSEGLRPKAGVDYKVETVNGQLDELPNDLKVFTIKWATTKFGDLDRANSIAQGIKFAVPPIKVEDGKALYEDKGGRSLSLAVELLTGNYTLTSDYLHNQTIITSQPGDEKSSLKIAGAFLRNHNFPESEFPPDKIYFIKYKIDDGKLVETFLLSNANLMQINYGRADIDKIPVLYTSFDNPKVDMLISSVGVVYLKFNMSNIEKYRFSTYPLKGIKSAYEDLKAGKAILNKKFEGNEFLIRSVSLAYLDTEKPEMYLQPVYVFKSDNGLLAFIRAVRDDYIIQN